MTVGSVSEERACFPNQVRMRRGGGEGLTEDCDEEIITEI